MGGNSVFSQEVLGGFLFDISGYLFYSKFMRCAPPSVPHIQSQHWYLHLSRDTHENTRASTHSSVPRKMSNRSPLGEQETSTSATTSANCVPANRERACCRREVRQQLTTAAATGAQLAGMTCSPQGKHEPLRIRLRIRLRPVVAVVTKETRTKRAATATGAAMLLLRGRLLIL